ncbi:hypothetical protein GA0115243_109621 [Streptomyces sp. ScaeMP-e83]|nr:hypothetical protein GA0115243_109621 [Streptomyces sp. ScaeMP-e83]
MGSVIRISPTRNYALDTGDRTHVFASTKSWTEGAP